MATHTLSLDVGKKVENNDHKREKSTTLQKTYEVIRENLKDIPHAAEYLQDLERTLLFKFEVVKQEGKSYRMENRQTIFEQYIFYN